MKTGFTPFCLTLALLASYPSYAETDKSDIKVIRSLLSKDALANIPGHTLTTLKVKLPPGEISAPHRHDAFVFAYVLEGHVRSQLDDEAPVDYATGVSWVEPLGAVHTLTQNLSQTEWATLLVVFVSK